VKEWIRLYRFQCLSCAILTSSPPQNGRKRPLSFHRCEKRPHYPSDYPPHWLKWLGIGIFYGPFKKTNIGTLTPVHFVRRPGSRKAWIWWLDLWKFIRKKHRFCRCCFGEPGVAPKAHPPYTLWPPFQNRVPGDNSPGTCLRGMNLATEQFFLSPVSWLLSSASWILFPDSWPLSYFLPYILHKRVRVWLVARLDNFAFEGDVTVDCFSIRERAPYNVNPSRRGVEAWQTGHAIWWAN